MVHPLHRIIKLLVSSHDSGGIQLTEHPIGEQAKAYVGTEARSGNHEEEETDSAGDPSAEFWKDYNAPFKEFARGYVNLKSMNGRLGSVDQRDGTVWPPFKRIDTLNWRL